jgi:hypothetical protein
MYVFYTAAPRLQSPSYLSPTQNGAIDATKGGIVSGSTRTRSRNRNKREPQIELSSTHNVHTASHLRRAEGVEARHANGPSHPPTSTHPGAAESFSRRAVAVYARTPLFSTSYVSRVFFFHNPFHTPQTGATDTPPITEQGRPARDTHSSTHTTHHPHQPVEPKRQPNATAKQTHTSFYGTMVSS